MIIPIGILVVLALAAPALAQEPERAEPPVLPPVVVTAPPPVAASSEVLIPGRDFELRPQGRPADVVRLIPGFVISQHQGGGKAEQYFLRGFDADHGTDVALFVDGMPVNLRSHAHGQGYADLHFLIPETVKLVDGLKGPYFVEFGDFATAGAVNFLTKDLVDANTVEVAGGTYYALSLFNNFTTFLGRPANGDEIKQRERRVLAGVDTQYAHRSTPLGVNVTTTGALEYRLDTPHIVLAKTAERHLLDRVQDA